MSSIVPRDTSSVVPREGERDWTYDVADRIESTVSAVRDRTAEPVMNLVDSIVFGVVAGVLIAVLIVLVVIVTFRLLDVYLPYQPESRRVWTTYAVTAAIFLASGMFLWRKRRLLS
jgi:hypothetical protein